MFDEGLNVNLNKAQSGCSIVDINIGEEHSEKEHSQRGYSLRKLSEPDHP